MKFLIKLSLLILLVIGFSTQGKLRQENTKNVNAEMKLNEPIAKIEKNENKVLKNPKVLKSNKFRTKSKWFKYCLFGSLGNDCEIYRGEGSFTSGYKCYDGLYYQPAGKKSPDFVSGVEVNFNNNCKTKKNDKEQSCFLFNFNKNDNIQAIKSLPHIISTGETREYCIPYKNIKTIKIDDKGKYYELVIEALTESSDFLKYIFRLPYSETEKSKVGKWKISQQEKDSIYNCIRDNFKYVFDTLSTAKTNLVTGCTSYITNNSELDSIKKDGFKVNTETEKLNDKVNDLNDKLKQVDKDIGDLITKRDNLDATNKKLTTIKTQTLGSSNLLESKLEALRKRQEELTLSIAKENLEAAENAKIEEQLKKRYAEILALIKVTDPNLAIQLDKIKGDVVSDKQCKFDSTYNLLTMIIATEGNNIL